MSMESWQAVPIILIVLAALVAWAIAAYSMIRMLGHTRGRWFALMFKPSWWRPSKVDEYIEPEGIPHYRRWMKCILIFMAAIAPIIIFSLIMAVLENPRSAT